MLTVSKGLLKSKMCFTLDPERLSEKARSICQGIAPDETIHEF